MRNTPRNQLFVLALALITDLLLFAWLGNMFLNTKASPGQRVISIAVISPPMADYLKADTPIASSATHRIRGLMGDKSDSVREIQERYEGKSSGDNEEAGTSASDPLAKSGAEKAGEDSRSRIAKSDDTSDSSVAENEEAGKDGSLERGPNEAEGDESGMNSLKQKESEGGSPISSERGGQRNQESNQPGRDEEKEGSGKGVEKGEEKGAKVAMTKPILRTTELPPYPEEARKLGLEGRVTVKLLVSDDGKVISAELKASSGHKLLDDAVMEFVKNLEFEPAKRDGKPVESRVTYRYAFKLRE